MATTKKTLTKKTAASKAAAPKKEAAPKAAGALEAALFSATGASAGTISLPAELFGAHWNADLVHQVVTGMQANARTMTAHAKNRGEVSGGGKKPWKQKGTGRARHGSTRSPIWVGGGVTHGPRAEKNYSVKINRKMRVAALVSLLSRKFKDGEVIFVDSLTFKTPKTADAVKALAMVGKAAKATGLMTKAKNSALIALSSKDENTEKSFRNIQNVLAEEARNLNVVDLATRKYLIVENPTATFALLTERITSK